MTDTALQRIAELLDGTEWDAGTIETVAEIVRSAGYTISQCTHNGTGADVWLWADYRCASCKKIYTFTG